MAEDTLTKKPKRKTVKKESQPEKEPVLPAAEPAEISEEQSSTNAVVDAMVAGARDDDRIAGKKGGRYFEAVGRRKTASARVRIFTKPGDFTVNEKLYSEYFQTVVLQKIVEDALQKMKLFGRFRVSVMVQGGGMRGQAEALRHGLSRALTKFNPDFRKRLKRAGFLRRDPRMKERKKFGLKKARRAPQWAKR